jgi:hypothetical protein
MNRLTRRLAARPVQPPIAPKLEHRSEQGKGHQPRPAEKQIRFAFACRQFDTRQQTNAENGTTAIIRAVAELAEAGAVS